MSLVRVALDRLFPPDPGWLRLVAAASATLAGLATFVIVALMGTVADVPPIDRLLGFAVALFIASTVRDSNTGGKLTTIASRSSWRRGVSDRLPCVTWALQRSEPTILSRIELIGAGGRQAPPFAAPGRLGEALDMLGRALSKTPSGEADYPASDKPASAAGWRPALQTAAASALAIACSELILPDRWYWAAFAAFVMFRETRSRGEFVAKGIAFVAGTSAGLVAGLLLATLLSGHELASLAAIVIAVFLAQCNHVAWISATVPTCSGVVVSMLSRCNRSRRRRQRAC